VTTVDTSFPRRVLLGILLLGFIGSGVDLFLLEHFQDITQWIPLAIIGLSIWTVLWTAVSPRRAALRWLQVAMILCAVAGPIGIGLHYSGNREFQLESDPSAGELALFLKVIRAKAPPILAPGVMMQLGLLGLAFTYRHPALSAPIASKATATHT
jgi:hypothetical protein